MYLVETIEKMAVDARAASRQLRKTGSEQKNDALKRMARMLVERREEIIAENQKDLSHAKEAGLSAAMIDRLTLDDKVIASMAEGLAEVAGLKDPVGEVTGMWKRPNGLLVGRVRIPLGVIGFIFES
ncbi:MAG TPA: gamma-glutamyl-phosphate reductase, partial [Deltaproteobacteria bacterium]|nr:gamma-glutamyl-phosphate reductase [Deltaproteobacteria bacterium]